jgi:hypothetical protein
VPCHVSPPPSTSGPSRAFQCRRTYPRSRTHRGVLGIVLATCRARSRHRAQRRCDQRSVACSPDERTGRGLRPRARLSNRGRAWGGRCAYKWGWCSLPEEERHLATHHECRCHLASTSTCLRIQLIAPRPPLAPAGVDRATRSLAPARSSAEQGVPRLALAVAAAQPHRRHHRPNLKSKSGLGTPQVAFRPRPAGLDHRFAGIWPDRRRPVPEDYIARSQVFLRA